MKDADRLEAGRREELGSCPLCGRVMFKGDSVDRHHWQPKSQGGTAAEYLHRICHRKLHSLFTGRELADRFSNPAQVQATSRDAEVYLVGAPPGTGAGFAPSETEAELDRPARGRTRRPAPSGFAPPKAVPPARRPTRSAEVISQGSLQIILLPFSFQVVLTPAPMRGRILSIRKNTRKRGPSGSFPDENERRRRA